MCINLKNNAYESCKQFRSISSSGIMCRKSLHVRTVISHFVAIGGVLKIETWHIGSLLLLEIIASEFKCDKPAEKMISPFECASVEAKVVTGKPSSLHERGRDSCLRVLCYKRLFTKVCMGCKRFF